MIRRIALLVWLTLLCSVYVSAAEEHSAKGIVLEVAASHHSFVASCEAIPGYMDAMEMPFLVRDAKVLTSLKPGMAVSFTIVTHGKDLYAEKIQPASTQSFESEPMEAGSLSALHSVLDSTANEKAVKVGEPVPDFVLTDQAQKEIRLSQMKGKVVALTFGYSRCPNPNYCLELVLMTIAIDPEHDQGSVLTEYANSFGANAEAWHFLTGTVADVKSVAAMFGMNFWSSEGLLTHPLHTVIIDRDGRLAVNLEGNQFTAKQLGDLVQSVMNRPS